MANIDGIIGYNSPSGNNKLLAAYGNDIIDVSTGLGYGLNLSSGQKAEFEVFIDTVFFCNGNDPMRAFLNNSTWSDSFSLPKQIVPKYIKKSVNNAQLLIGNCILTPGSGTPLNYKSYVFRSNVPVLGKSPTGSVISQKITWGIESGKCNLTQNTRKVKAIYDGNGRLPYFISNKIKVGDPFFLLGGDIGEYTVASVDSEYELTLNESIPSTGNNSIDFWVGSNFFPVATDDNDQIMGFGHNNSRDLIFKLFSLWVYTGTQLKPVQGAPGTSSNRSIINDWFNNTYYFHGSDLKRTGIYQFNGVTSVKASAAIDPFIEGMAAANYASVVAWQEGYELRFFLGDITNVAENISMTNAVASLNMMTNAWSVDTLADVITCSTQYIVSNVRNSYCGNASGQVLKMGSGYNHNGVAIPAVLETGVRYPSGSEIQNTYPFIQVTAKNAKGVRISYKRWNKPKGIDDSWIPLGELTDDLTEFEPDTKRRLSSGLQFRVEEDGVLENDWLIEKIGVFYKPDTSRLL